MTDYHTFLARKAHHGVEHGFEPIAMPSQLFPFQQMLTDWAIRRGRAALFEDCGMGKTAQLLTWADNVVRHTGKRVLVLTPLAVGTQTVQEGEKFGIACQQSRNGTLGTCPIVVTNYEQLHHFAPQDFIGAVADEASIIKHFSGATQQSLTRFMASLPYRLLDTATAAPNDRIELGTLSEALGELGYSDMLSRFFVQDDKKKFRMNEVKLAREANHDHYAKLAYRIAQTIGQYHLKAHAEMPFWRWVASWARACRKPSDLGFDDGPFQLPPLIERPHTITPSRPADGYLFDLPAYGLSEEREERKRTLHERCEYAAELVSNHDDHSLLWCHYNAEGDLLEQLIPFAIQVKGSDSDAWKTMAAQWFVGNKCICTEPLFRAKLTTWRRNLLATGSNTIKTIVSKCLNEQSDMPTIIEKKNADILLNTTSNTRINGLEHRKRNGKRRKRQKNDTTMIQSLDKVGSTRSNDIDSDIQQLDSSDSLQDMMLHSSNTSNLKQGVAESAAEQQTEIAGTIDSILTTITRPEHLEDSSPPIAIMDSASSKMIQSYLNEPSCICGHRSGKRVLISKSKIFGFGLNFQHCHYVVTFVSHSWEQYYQSIRRCWRFGQTSPVTVDVIATRGEERVADNMRRKAEASIVMFERLIECMNDATGIARTSTGHTTVEIPSWL